jgi:GT2 family glycosyltransferase
MIPVLGFATLKRFDLADRLLASIDYPVEHLVIVDNSGLDSWQPKQPAAVKKMWVIRIPYGLGLVGAWNLIVKATPYAPYWVLINDDAHFELGAMQIIAEHANPEGVGHPVIEPKWTCMVLGEQAVQTIGLYDERFYPLYFDDNDYERRLNIAGVPQYSIPAVIHHDNSSSLDPVKNTLTFRRNQAWFLEKQQTQDLTWSWTLDSRRANRWD